MNNQYGTLVEAIQELQKRGFSHNLRVNENGQLEDSNGDKYGSPEVKLVEFHRFEGLSNPSDSSIVYALETSAGVKGAVVDSYGADSSETTSEFMNKVEKK